MLYQTFFHSPQVDALFTNDATIGSMLQFESALAQAQAKHGMILQNYADVISENCLIENIDIEALIAQVGQGGNACIPLVKQLTEVVKKQNPEAASYVHFGATSQDVIDSATMLQAKDSVIIIHKYLQKIITQLQILSQNHQQTPMIGRSFMQQARPITFGYKVDTWLDGLQRSKARIEQILKENFVVQLGGAVGNKSAFGTNGEGISETLAAILGLKNTSISWHTQRDRFVEIATVLGILVGIVSKIAKDISLMMQTEIAEVFEPSEKGKGGSSTMPHKRNPVSCIAILANAQRIPNLVATMLSSMTQDHERATGQWHAEWETFSQIIQLTGGTLHQAVNMTNGLEVNTLNMLKNLEATNGLIHAETVSLALSKYIGKTEAHHFVEKSCQEAVKQGIHLRDYLRSQAIMMKHFSESEIVGLFRV
ncbi:MAG: 3-carboxy-cis,cis-muconate cycloisomerase [Arcicella sp.]|nr:3-carboxy-cis,cis-muconate cycloisomerase [Arcicella sp.]